MFTKAQGPMEEHMGHAPLHLPQTGMIIHRWCAKPNNFLTVNEVNNDMQEMNEWKY